MSRTLTRLSIPVALLLVGIASYGLTNWLSPGPDPLIAAQGGPPPQEELERFDARVQAQLREDESKPRFTGAAGDFRVVTVDDEASPSLFCVDGVRESNSEFVDSELNQTGMTEQLVCADGIVAATYSLELGRRSYFADSPSVYANAPEDRLELTDIEGHPALIVNPPTDFAPYFVYIIPRPATESQPGILISFIAGPEREKIFEKAAAALAE